MDGNTVTALVGTDSVAAGVYVVQHQAGEGPGLDAINQGGTIYAEDPGRRSQLGVPRVRSIQGKGAHRPGAALSDDASRGAALILYARYPRAFGALDGAKGVILAAMAGSALSAADPHEDEVRHPSRPPWPPWEMIG